MQPTRPSVLLLLACLLGALGPSLRARAEKSGVDLRKWIDGPVRYIALKDEVRAFRQLDTDEDRAFFIERFWQKRDPDTSTLGNEYRQLFWERVQQANESFQDRPGPGWMSDRGKIWILYGPPSETEEYIDLNTGEPGKSGRGIIRWIYDGRPSGRKDLAPTVVVPFERDGTGEYKVSYDPRLASVYFSELRIRENWDESDNPDFLPMGRSELSVMLDLGRMQEVPPQEQILLERVETAEAYRTEPLSVQVDQYVHGELGGTLAVVTVNLSDYFETENPAIIARFTPYDATRENRILGEGSFRVVDDGAVRLAQGRLRLDPGRYALTVMVADPVAVRTGMHRTEVQIPEPAERFRFSDLTFAEQIEPVEYTALVTYDEPFIVGPYRVLPKTGTTFRPGEPVRLFYEVYGGELPLRVTYRLEGRDLDGSWVPLGRPDSAEQDAISQAWELPTGENWPAGEYRISVEVYDSAERLIGTHRSFTLEPVPR